MDEKRIGSGGKSQIGVICHRKRKITQLQDRWSGKLERKKENNAEAKIN